MLRVIMLNNNIKILFVSFVHHTELQNFLNAPRSSILYTWLMTYTWFQIVLDIGSTRPSTDRTLFHAHATHLATEALLPPGHVFGTAFQYTCRTKTLNITVLGMNWKRVGSSVASGVHWNILPNCTIQIPVLWSQLTMHRTVGLTDFYRTELMGYG